MTRRPEMLVCMLYTLALYAVHVASHTYEFETRELNSCETGVVICRRDRQMKRRGREVVGNDDVSDDVRGHPRENGGRCPVILGCAIWGPDEGSG